jgi:Na+/proline symporter
VVASYSTAGGLRGVVATDIGQLAIMLVGTAVFTGIVVSEVGGLTAMTHQIHTLFATGGPGGIQPDEILAFTPDRAKDASASVLGLLAVLWLVQLNSDGSGYLAQRTMACRSDQDAKTAAVVFTYTQVVLRSLLWLPLGLGLLILFPPDPGLPFELIQADREASYVRGMVELLPAGARGLLLTGMLAAVASTVDTHLNWGASYWTNDIYKRFVCQSWLRREPSDRSLVWVARTANLAIVGIALLIMTGLTSINQAWQTSLLMGAGMGVVLILRWIWWRVNAWAEIGAALVSVVAAPVLMLSLGNDAYAMRLLIMAVTATCGALVAIWLAGPEEHDQLVTFYKKVRPVGFWGPVAAAAGDSAEDGPRRLRRATVATMACALSAFCLLVGVGTWLTGAPPPVWCPWPAVWITTLLGVGLALIPVWRILSRESPGHVER